MKDASDLVDALKVAVVEREKTLLDVITAYEEELRPRGTNEVALSYEQAKKTRNPKTVKDAPSFRIGHSRETQ